LSVRLECKVYTLDLKRKEAIRANHLCRHARDGENQKLHEHSGIGISTGAASPKDRQFEADADAGA